MQQAPQLRQGWMGVGGMEWRWIGWVDAPCQKGRAPLRMLNARIVQALRRTRSKSDGSVGTGSSTELDQSSAGSANPSRPNFAPSL